MGGDPNKRCNPHDLCSKTQAATTNSGDGKHIQRIGLDILLINNPKRGERFRGISPVGDVCHKSAMSLNDAEDVPGISRERPLWNAPATPRRGIFSLPAAFAKRT
jgi:hypothetical protein